MGASSSLLGACRRPVAVFLLPALFLAVSVLPAAAGTILVKPGKLDHFVLTAPESAIAGESFLVRIDPYDANGNLITDSRAKGSSFSIRVSGGAEVVPDRIRPSDFAGGVTAKVSGKKAEIVELMVVEGTAVTPLSTVQVPVYPNKLDHFSLNVPKTARSGEPFQVRIIARDAFDNIKFDLPDIRANIAIDYSGTGSLKRADKALPSFRSGEMILSFEPIKVGKAKITVEAQTTHSRGESSEIEIGPAPLNHFIVQGPKAVVAGEEFLVTFSAMDRNENLVTSYSARGDGVMLHPSGNGVLEPLSIGPKDFRDGQAKVKVRYTVAGTLKITARETNGDKAGTSEAITVVAGEPDHFIVTTPEEAVAGETFPIGIEAIDRFGNTIEDYDLRGLEVYLSADGTGRIEPSSVSPASFSKGKATVSISYNRAESFSVIAALSKEDIDRIIRERGRRSPAAAPPSLTPEDVAREKERSRALKARQEALKARIEGEDRARDEKEAAMRAREEAQRALEELTPPPAPAAEPPPPPEEAAPPAEPPPLPPLEEVIPPAPVPERIPLPEPLPSEAVKPLRVAKRTVQELKQISLIESKGQAMIMLETAGPVSYNASTGSALSKEWIYIELFPVKRDRSRVSDLIEIESELVGDVLVEEVEADKVKVSLQVLPPGISYVVSQQDRAVVVKIIKNE
jgi:hypothetical protein